LEALVRRAGGGAVVRRAGGVFAVFVVFARGPVGARRFAPWGDGRRAARTTMMPTPATRTAGSSHTITPVPESAGTGGGVAGGAGWGPAWGTEADGDALWGVVFPNALVGVGPP
jgi:hypothetical protein